MLVGLVERAQAGDQAAFAALAEASLDRCYALAYRILHDMPQAQDATQQALLGAWRDLPGLRDPARFDAWLHRLVVRACYAEAARQRQSSPVRLISAVRASEPDPAGLVADRDELERAFCRLPPDQRAVLVLHYYLGYRLTEIAQTLGIPTGTARSRLHYASRQLRAAIEADARPINLKERTA